MKAVTNSLRKGHGFFTLLLCSHGVGESNSCISEDDDYYYLYIIYFERLDFVLCQFGLCWISGFSLMNC